MLILYTLTLFLSASLLFVIQPLFTRLVMPLLGGSPAVWNTSQAFFQAALLGGYAYAYAASRWLRSRWQIGLHLLLGLAPLALLLLPIRIPEGWAPPTASNPLPWLLGLLTLAVGLPFFVLAATTPLLQQWFTRTGHPAAADPYFLYAASNAGSLLALLSYPILIEPNLRLTQQSWGWTGGYALLIGLIAVCGIMLWRQGKTSNVSQSIPTSQEHPSSESKTERETVTRRKRIRWMLLAFAPVSLMLSITTYISTDVAAIPLLWVIPLAIYLLTFVLVFARKPPLPHSWIIRIAPLAVLVLVWIVAAKAGGVAIPLILIQFVALFIIGMLCHGELARDRPDASSLTEFYLWISLGGVLGGIFNALIAPWLFTNVIEYPITLVLIGLLLPKDERRPESRQRRKPHSKSRRWIISEKYRWPLDLGLPVLLFGVTAALLYIFQMYLFEPPMRKGELSELAVMFGVPALICFAFHRRPLRFGFGLGVGAILLAGMFVMNEGGQLLYAERSFFGVNRVFVFQGGSHHLLMHGNTLHGAQSLNPALRKMPLTYYYPNGPLGQVFEMLKNDETERKVAVVGLGAGSIACYTQVSSLLLTFYEIDPSVERIARNPRYFNFIQDCAPETKVILGDGRLSLASASDGEYDLIILDAFSSDAVPLHLLTREALQLYLKKLAPSGLLIFHITSRHFALAPVLGNLARDAGLAYRVRSEKGEDIQPADSGQGKMPSDWAVLARTPADLDELGSDPHWVALEAQRNARVWTDDFASLLSVLK